MNNSANEKAQPKPIIRPDLKTGILVHGCNLNAENWRYIAWGDVPGHMGRVPQGLLAAMTMDAEVIVFGTGASRKKYNFPGSSKFGQVLLEAEYTYEFLNSRFDLLLKFKAFDEACPASSQAEWDAIKQSLRSRIYLDTQSNNTTSELEEAGKIFLKHGCRHIVLISSPTHLVRVLRDASKVFKTSSEYAMFSDHVLAMPSTTCYEGTTPGDVVVVEPPHRPDRHVAPTHRRIARMQSLQRLETDVLVDFITEFDELLQRYEDVLQRGAGDFQNLTWIAGQTAEMI